MKQITITEAMIVGAVSIEQHSEGLQPWRIPHERRELYYPLIGVGSGPAGVRLQLTNTSSDLTLCVLASENDRSFDCCRGNELISSVVLAAGESRIHFEDAAGDIDIWLPVNVPVIVQHLEIADNADCSPRRDERLKWLTYGSSITQCGAAFSPARTWPATAARKHDLHLQCLGFSGNCMMESLTARMISQQQADLITLKLGINVMGNGSLNQRTYQSAVIGLIALIREHHPKTPIGVITSIFSAHREEEPNVVGMSLKDYRRETVAAVERHQAYGDDRLHVYDGLDVFGPEQAEYLPDDLHPNGEGYELLGQNIADHVIADLLQRYFK